MRRYEKTGEGGKVNEPASSEKRYKKVLNMLPTGTNAIVVDSDRSRLTYPRAKPARTCKEKYQMDLLGRIIEIHGECGFIFYGKCDCPCPKKRT